MKTLLDVIDLSNEPNILGQRGGKREGSGRPKGKPTKVLSYRVPQKIAAKFDKEVKKILAFLRV